MRLVDWPTAKPNAPPFKPPPRRENEDSGTMLAICPQKLQNQDSIENHHHFARSGAVFRLRVGFRVRHAGLQEIVRLGFCRKKAQFPLLSLLGTQIVAGQQAAETHGSTHTCRSPGLMRHFRFTNFQRM